MTGTSRDFMLAVYGTYTVTLNTGTAVEIQTPAATVWNAIPQAGDILTVPADFGSVTPGFYQVTSATQTTVSAARLSEGLSTGGAGSLVYSSGAEPIQLLQAIIQGAGKTLSLEGNVDSIFLNAAGQSESLANSQLICSSKSKISQMTILKRVSGYSKSYQGGGNDHPGSWICR